jgi:peptidoglycan hydrolase-like protein with peptidoglycan-binding domain
MTRALVANNYDPAEHPHLPAGSPTGGQFGPGGGNSAPAKSAPKAAPKPAAKKTPTKPNTQKPATKPGPPTTTLAYDPHSNTGPGYNMPHGDPNVHLLQQALNRLGLTDIHGKKLADDGKLGPLTTQSIKAAQKRLGLKQDGQVTPELFAKLTTATSLPALPAKVPGKPKAPVKAAEYANTPGTHFADPGYQEDGKKRYPLDSESECRSAWSYINQADNAAKYTPEQLAKVKAAIKAAGEKYGIQFSGEVNASAGPDLLGVELARPGSWKLASGPVTFTEQNLRDAADFFTASGGQAVPVKLGHNDNRFDGEPTFGSVTNVRYAEDDRGPVLLGDITGMPGWLSAAAPTRWPNRSIEGWQNFTYEGREYSLVLSGLAFLGVTPPGVRNIRSLADLQTALAASSAVRLVASAPTDDLSEPPHAPAVEAEEPTEGMEAGQMDPAKIREALGLPADASDEDVKAALVTAGFAEESAPPEPVQASLFEPTGAKTTLASAPKREAAGTMRVDASAWEAAQDRIKKLEAQAQKAREAERDQVITQAVQDGKFAPARRDHWSKLWDLDPEGIREAINGLAKNVIPVMAMGHSGEGDDDLDAEYAHLFPPTASSRKGA